MTDREMLELAAKAIGHRVIWYGPNPEVCLVHAPSDASGTRWNPLTDDGDALRLAVKLKLIIYAGVDFGASVSIGVDGVLRPLAWEGYGAFADDERKQAATRRAIVRAAAVIEKVMP